MAYVPIDPTTDLYAGIRGTATAYQTLWGNHNEIYENSSTPIFDLLFAESLPDSLTDVVVFTWRMRRNRDLMPVRLRVYAESSPTSSTLTFRVGGASTTATVAGAAAWYELNVTPALAGPVVCSLSVTTPASETLTLTRLQCRLVSSSPAAGLLASGYSRLGSADMYATSAAVASEHVTRLLAGPVCVARDRPAAVAYHIVRAHAPTTGKALRNWHSYNTTNAELVGRLRVPRCSTRSRRYIVDAYTIESSGGGSAVITIGGVDLEIPSMGGTSGAWSTWELDLPVGPHDVRAAVLPGASNAARIATLQVWRARGDY